MSDIEGSTRLVALAGAKFPALLDEHFAVMRGAIEEQGGTIVSTEGDSVFAVLPTARAALAAAIAAQRGLEQHSWPDGMQLRVRIGIHVGEAVFGGRDYTGIDVHRTARVMAAAWGGEIIVTSAVESLVRDALDAGVTLRELGTHTLRDIVDSELLYQVVAPGLRADFPPPRTESAAARTNLPTPLTRFVGRARELKEVEQLVASARLVTLTGPGGTGKTRLAIEVGRASLATFPDGVFFVALDAVRDPDLVVPQIAQTLGLVEDASRPLAEVLAAYLSGRRLLLILDNLEQVISAAPRIAALLGAATTFVVLGSSREALGIAGETIYPVPPLTLPSEPGTPTAEQVARMEAVELFVERARGARPGFELTDDNAAAVAAICRRVDGLPLAIELAAARVNVLTPQQILDRLDHRLTLLSGSRRDVTDRQRTLRGAIDWSHDLLSDDEKAGFRRFSVFSAGAQLDAVLAVLDPASELGADPLDVVAALVDRSLLRRTEEASGSRFSMLETIREYAAESLVASEEADATRDRHAEYFGAVAAASEDVLYTPDRNERLDALDLELPNFRAALEWSIERHALARCAHMALGLREFLRTRSHIAESRRLFDRVLDNWTPDELPGERADVLGVAAELAAWQMDYGRARQLTEVQIAVLDETGDRPRLSQAYNNMAWGTLVERPEVARDMFDRAIAIAADVGDLKNEMTARQGLAIALLRLGDLQAARDAAQEAIDVANQTRDQYTNLLNIMTLGMIEWRMGDAGQGAKHFGDALSRAEAASAAIGVGVSLDAISLLAFEHGEVERAAVMALVADRVRRESGGAPTMELIGYGAILDVIREKDPQTLERVAASIGDVTMADAIATAYSVTNKFASEKDAPKVSG